MTRPLLRHIALWITSALAGCLTASAQPRVGIEGQLAKPIAQTAVGISPAASVPSHVQPDTYPAAALCELLPSAGRGVLLPTSDNPSQLPFGSYLLPCSSFLSPRQLVSVRVRLLFAGDLMQHLPQVTSARRADGFDYAPVFEYVKPLAQQADIAVVNLETTLTRSDNYTGYPRFRSPAALADAVRDAGFGVAVMANNHCCDGDGVGVRTTLAELARCGIRRTGVFADSLDLAAHHPLRIKARGVRFALLNYTYGTNGIAVPRGVVVNQIDTVRMAADLALARSERTDCVVVCIHWGEEYERRESAAQRRIADFLRRHGADVIVGSHPHVVQPWQADSSHVVLYSLGNFVSNQRERHTDGGLLAAIEAVRHPDGRMEYRLETIPVWVALPGYRILPFAVADTMRLSEAYARFRSDFNDFRP